MEIQHSIPACTHAVMQANNADCTHTAVGKLQELQRAVATIVAKPTSASKRKKGKDLHHTQPISYIHACFLHSR